MAVSFTPSQTGASSAAVPVAWTANPISLMWSDTLLFFKLFNNVFGVVVPGPEHPLDEMYPSVANIACLLVHGFLIFYQLVFLASIPICLTLMPGLWFLVYCAAIIGFNKLVTYPLNGPAFEDSTFDLSKDEPHPEERWIFLNGVSVGSHWLRGNVNRLAMTFRRPVRGVHNPTDGIVFDLIRCLIERNCNYSTSNVREAYVQIKDALIDKQYKKVVLIFHSEGGIQGSLIVDWLLDEVPQSLLEQVEIYTFGNAANHFNNPHREVDTYLSSLKNTSTTPITKSISHIEHYGSSGDFVARWGVLNFSSMRNRYMGRIFERPGNGHLLNQHYLNAIFPLGNDDRVLERNTFMETAVKFEDHDSGGNALSNGTGTNGTQISGQDHRLLGGDGREDFIQSLLRVMTPDTRTENPPVVDVNSPLDIIKARASINVRVKDFSRLWQYRNGMSPPKL